MKIWKKNYGWGVRWEKKQTPNIAMNVFFVFYFAPATNCMILIEVCLVNTQKKNTCIYIIQIQHL